MRHNPSFRVVPLRPTGGVFDDHTLRLEVIADLISPSKIPILPSVGSFAKQFVDFLRQQLTLGGHAQYGENLIERVENLARGCLIVRLEAAGVDLGVGHPNELEHSA